MNHRVTSKDQILDVAADIALKDGIDSLSVRKVATACGIAVGSVYNYCKNKEELTRAVMERFWDRVLKDQDKLFFKGISFTDFLERYYALIYGRLSDYDDSWVAAMSVEYPSEKIIPFMLSVLEEDNRVDRSIWNMELTEEIFCDNVFVNLLALLRSGESGCRFYIFLLEHLLYNV